MSQKIEIVVEDVDGARIAANEGADSIELCVALDCGGPDAVFRVDERCLPNGKGDQTRY